MADVPATESQNIERLTNYFEGQLSPQKAAPRTPVVQPEAPVSEEAPVEEAPVAVETQESEEEAPQEQVSDEQPPEGFVELEHLGNKYFVPPDLKKAFEDNRAQGTKATQEVKLVRQALEVERVALQTDKAFSAEVRELESRKAELKSYIDQADKLNWRELTLDQKVDLDRELNKITKQLGEIDQEIEGRKAAHKQKFSQLVVAAVNATEQFMAQKIPNWNVESGKALHEYGLNNGIPVEKLTTGYFADPTATLMMWKAQQWDRLQGSKPAVTNKASNAPPVIKPGSNAVQKAVASSNYQKAREKLRKSGSVDDAAALFLKRMK